MDAIDHTFVIPAYKDSKYLEDCVRSLKQQTLAGSIVITTSTPSDFIVEIARKYNIAIITNDKGGSIAADWNFALSAAKTKLVTLVHQDDFYNTDFLETIINQWNQEKKILISFTDYEEIVNGVVRKGSLNLKVKKMLLFPFVLKSKIHSKFIKILPLLFGNPICCPTVTYNKVELTDFIFSSDYENNLDWNAWIELSRREGAFLFINRKLMKHRIHRDSETSSQLKTNNRALEEQKMFEIIWGKRVGKFIARLYMRSHKDNIV